MKFIVGVVIVSIFYLLFFWVFPFYIKDDIKYWKLVLIVHAVIPVGIFFGLGFSFLVEAIC